MSVIIRTRSKDEYDELMEFLESKGICWRSGDNATVFNYYPVYGILISKSADGEDRIVCVKCSEELANHLDAEVVTVEEYVRRNKDMKKDDLKNGMIVKTREGNFYLVIEYDSKTVLVREEAHMMLSQYADDLTVNYSLKGTLNCLDIVEVYAPSWISTLDLQTQALRAQMIWKRDEKPTEMTIAEIEEKLGIKNLKVVKEKDNE